MRLFWAVTVPGDVSRAIDADVAPLRDRCPALRWTPPQNWHLTLAFLGQVDPDAIDPLTRAVEEAVRASGDVAVTLAATAGTPGRRGGVVWIPTVDDQALRALAESVRDAVDPVAPADRRHAVTGHLTVARIPRDLPAPGRLAADVAAAYQGRTHQWTAGEVTLLSSHPSADGVAYRRQTTIPLAGP